MGDCNASNRQNFRPKSVETASYPTSDAGMLNTVYSHTASNALQRRPARTAAWWMVVLKETPKTAEIKLQETATAAQAGTMDLRVDCHCMRRIMVDPP